MKIIVDAFGGDNAPLEMIKGAKMAQQEYGVQVLLSGERNSIAACAKENGLDISDIEIIDAEGMIPVEADPTTLLKEYENCSMAAGLRALKEGKADAFLSAGSTGALVVGASLIIKRIKGVRRTAIPTVIPNETGCFMLIDSGANAEVNSDMLLQFGMMGSVYMNKVMGRKDPAVALVNNGAEDTKGTPMYREAHGLLKANPAIRFVGNIEPRDIMAGEVDVIVCDGFVGNVVLKLTEGVAGTLLGMLKDIFMQSIVTKLCYLGVKGGLRNLKHMMDSEEIGGAPLLGAAKPVIKAHGSSKAKGIKNAIRQAKLCVANDLCGTMQSALAEVAAKAAAEKTDAE